MAAMNSWLISCIVLVHSAYLGSCESDTEIADGAQPELFIFHELCALKKDVGPCKTLKERFYFEIDTGRCESFEFGGCRGNANNFETLEACEGMCLVSADKSPCHLDEAPGPCRGLVTRYFFDSQSQECKHFYYGGCFGNANNFKSMKACQARCQNPGEFALSASHMQQNHQHQATDFSPPEFCLSTIDKGTTCDREERRTERRYVYNPKTKRCHWLRNRGCGGSKNNFVFKRHCMKICMKPNPTHKRNTIRIKKNTNILFQTV
ncbi:tissue factor pathway inhibitor isoform X3 [Salmo salar]|uniref:Tissue factor pathway inhibitor n=1 Tax=Salmo salar TaxID=8030 RepID=A0A1S3NWZ0_SALSA|nr:tissue factor pathway inhibitor-like isoform X3 [Salmo salar]|eukprot:XP_014019912.1 PREDICTED: tissue factor pathway inhibitor-like isoform X3 [Salmo salar]